MSRLKVFLAVTILLFGQACETTYGPEIPLCEPHDHDDHDHEGAIL